MTDRSRPGSKSDSGFKRPSSWQGFFSSSIEPSSVLALVKRAMTGQTAVADDNVSGKVLSSLEDVKKHLLGVLDDCRDSAVRQRIANQIVTSPRVADLWLLRPDIYQYVACERGQGEAMRRINELLPLFEGWVPATQLSRV